MISNKEAPKEKMVKPTDKSDTTIDESIISNITCPGRTHTFEKNKLDPEIQQIDANTVKSDHINQKNKTKTKYSINQITYDSHRYL